MRVRSGTATGERCPARRGPSSARGESEWRSWERPAERPGPESGELCALHPNPATDLLPRYIAQVERNLLPHIWEARKKKPWGAHYCRGARRGTRDRICLLVATP